MMKLLKIAAVILLCTHSITTMAQPNTLKVLSIGDKMPDMTLSPVIKYDKPVFKTADYANKLLILDFWATWCHWCVAAFPKEDLLSVKFGSKLQFILVDGKTDDTAAKVEDFYAKRTKADKGFKLPSVYLDTVLVKLFPHRLIPHYVWVRSGVIVAITDAEEINEANIREVLSGKNVNFKKKTL